MLPTKIQIIGNGNVAFHLARGFSSIAEIKEISLLSRNSQREKNFLSISNKITCARIASFDYSSPMTLIAVSDDAIVDVLESLSGYKNLIMHTSGSTDTGLFKDLEFYNYGAFYPLQTFSFEREVMWSEIPIFITSNSAINDKKMFDLASKLSKNTLVISDEQRLSIHIAAVMVNNFTNYLFSLSETWLKSNDLDFKILMPLIHETVAKLETLSPKFAQTGPAKRKDLKTIEKHLNILKNQKKMLNIYELMTTSIMEKGISETEEINIK